MRETVRRSHRQTWCAFHHRYVPHSFFFASFLPLPKVGKHVSTTETHLTSHASVTAVTTRHPRRLYLIASSWVDRRTYRCSERTASARAMAMRAIFFPVCP